MSIFRAYDIRGICPGQLNEHLAYRIGLAFGKYLSKGKAAVGMDSRESGPSLKENFVKGLSEQGIEVIDIGMVPTPAVYFAVASRGLDGGAMITGSHNPKEYNGIKLCKRGAICLSYETGIEEIEKMVKTGEGGLGRRGRVRKVDIGNEYSDFVAGSVKMKRPLKVVVDAGNGSGGEFACEIFRKLGCEVIELNCKPDGRFPNHHPDPLVRKNLEQLCGKVKEENADLGIAYDGDADRVGFVDERGRVFENNKAFALMIKNVLRKNPGGKILYEVLCSKMVEDVIKKEGGKPVVSRVGHSYIQAKMMEEEVLLGGETSGHYYFKESYNYDDGIFGSAKLAELVANSGKGVSELGKELPEYFTSDDTRVECDDDKKFEVIGNLKKRFEKLGHINDIDGVKVVMDKSWFIVRASNTQPALVLRWESSNREEFERVGKFVKKEVGKEIAKVSGVK